MAEQYWHQCPHCGHTEQHYRNTNPLASCSQCEKLYRKNELSVTEEQERPMITGPVQHKTSQQRAEEAVFIDYCSFTYEVDGTSNAEVAIHRAAQMLTAFVPFLDIEVRGRGFHGFYESAVILVDGIPAGMIASGASTHRRTYVELTGLACGLVNFQAFGQMLFDLRARLSRVDAAMDFFNGEITPQQIRESYRNGEFKNRGQNPTSSMVGPWDDETKWGEGLTYYIGKRQNGKMLRAYHKGRQLGDQESNWTRVEVELRRAGNTDYIPFKILQEPETFFVGAFPWLSRIKECVAQKVDRVKKAAQITFDHLIKYGRQSYGALIAVMQSVGMPADQIVNKLIQPDKVPRRLMLCSVAYGTER
jgi:phage replication initiation protein